MSDWESLLNDYIIRYSNQIRAVTRPLRDHLGVGLFSYHKIYLNGTCVPILDLPHWLEIFINEKIYNYKSIVEDYRSCENGCYLLNYFGSPEYITRINELGGKFFNAHQNIILFEKTDQYVEFFDFYGKPDSIYFQNIYMNHMPLLKKFKSFFKKELTSLLLEIEENAFSFIDIKKSASIEKFNPLPCHEFLISIGLKDYVESSKILSSREKECLTFFLKGYSAKETGSVLAISPRTVESYFETIKKKCKCWGKNEIFTLAKELEELSLLSNDK